MNRSMYPSSFAPVTLARPVGLGALSWVLGACIGTLDLDDGGTSSAGTSTSSDTGVGSSSDASSATGTTATTIETGGSASTSTDEGSSESTGAPSFACPPAVNEQQCDLLTQDCPPDWHCIPYDADGNGEGDSTACAPLDAAASPRLGPCTSDASTCTDSCEVGATCFEGLTQPLCLRICSFDGDDAGCQADEYCVSCASCSFGTCLPACDPLASECDDPLPTCVYSQSESSFLCSDIELLGATAGEPCEFSNACAEGLVCATAEEVGGCGEGAAGCCTALCDLDDGDAGCTSPLSCEPFFLPGTARDGLEDLGACVLPEADPCLEPGACPPDGVDDTYPWCSLSNEGLCNESAIVGYGDTIACEQGCLCDAPCDEPSDCPTPPTGTAVPTCVEEPYGVGSPTTCLLRCGDGELCPDGMTCGAFVDGDPVCGWVSPLPPDECE